MDFLKRIYRRGKSSTLLSGAFMALLGVICLGYGEQTVLGIVRLVGIVSLILGICKLTDTIIHKQSDSAVLTVGIIELIVGLVLTLSPDAFINIVFILLGIAVAGLGATAFSEASEGANGRDKAVGICDIVLGVVMAIAPFAFINAVTIIAGVALLFAGLTQIVAAMSMEEDPVAKDGR